MVMFVFCCSFPVLVSLRFPLVYYFLQQGPTLPFGVDFSYVCTALQSLLSSFLVIFILPPRQPFGDGTIHFHFAEELTKPERLTDEAASWRMKTIF